MARLQPSTQSMDEFMEIDEAHDVFDPEDIKEVLEQRKKSTRSQVAFETFGNDLSDKRRSLNGGNSGSAYSGGAGINGRKKLSLPQEGRIPQSEGNKTDVPWWPIMAEL